MRLAALALMLALPSVAMAAPVDVRIDMGAGDMARSRACAQVRGDLAAAVPGSPISLGARQAYDRLGCRDAGIGTAEVSATGRCDAMRLTLRGDVGGFRRLDLSEAYAEACEG